MGKITEVRVEQVHELVTLALKLYKGSNEEELYNEFLELVPSDKHKFLFYIEEDEPIAFMHLSVREDYVEGSTSSPTGYIEGVYVESEYRRKGISTKLFQEGKKWLREKGCKQVGSDMEMDNKDSYPFHMSLGFQEAGRIITFIKDLNN